MFKLAILIFGWIVFVGADKSAQISNYENVVNFDGEYKYQYGTSNGITQQEFGIAGKSAQGSAQWYSPNGEPISLSYVADSFGYRPTGSHIPTPHPIPDYILKSIEQNRIAAELRSRQKQ